MIEGVSKTAVLVAYASKLANIPYADLIFRQLDEHEAMNIIARLIRGAESMLDRLVIQMAARSSLIRHQILESGVSQVIGLAEGLSAHGLHVTDKRESLLYIDTDLPAIFQQKQEVLRRLRQHRPNLLLHELDALETNAVDQLARAYLQSGRPVAINVEGLVPYLNNDQRRVLLGNVRRVLEAQGGGLAIISGVMTREHYQTTNAVASVRSALAGITAETGCDMWELAFETSDAAMQLFRSEGLHAERVNHLQYRHQITRWLGSTMPKANIEQSLNRMNSYILTLPGW